MRFQEHEDTCKICGDERFWGVSNLLCEKHYHEYIAQKMRESYARKKAGQSNPRLGRKPIKQEGL